MPLWYLHKSVTAGLEQLTWLSESRKRPPRRPSSTVSYPSADLCRYPWPFPDAIIATLAIATDIEVWTGDHHYSLIQRVLPALKLFQVPP